MESNFESTIPKINISKSNIIYLQINIMLIMLIMPIHFSMYFLKSMFLNKIILIHKCLKHIKKLIKKYTFNTHEYSFSKERNLFLPY